MAKRELDRTSIKISSEIYKQLATYLAEDKKKDKSLTMQSFIDNILDDYMVRRDQDRLFEDSKLQILIDNQFKKMDKHLASMIARNQMDLSIVVVGLIDMIYHVFGKEEDRTSLYEDYRTQGARYFTGKSDIYPRSREKEE